MASSLSYSCLHLISHCTLAKEDLTRLIYLSKRYDCYEIRNLGCICLTLALAFVVVVVVSLLVLLP